MNSKTLNPGKESFSILFLGTQMAVGGAQRILLDQADWFHAHGYRVVVVFFYDRDGLWEEWQRTSPYPIYNLEVRQPGAGFVHRQIFFLRGLIRLWKLLHSERFSVIETFTLHSNVPGVILAWLAGVPLRLATHHGKIGDVPQWQERLHLLVTGKVSSVVVAVSTKVRNDLVSAGVDPGRVVVIPNGIKLFAPDQQERAGIREALNLHEGKIVLISVGRLIYQKAHSVLINAMPTVLAQCPDAILFVAGEGPLRKDLEDQITRLDLTGKVHLLGNRNDVRVLLSLADIFVLPSRWEGLPMALLEAMGAGLTVVATKVEGVEEVVQQNIHGLLVPPEDPGALANALLLLIINLQLRKEMGAEARKRIAQSYTTNIMCEKYLRLMLSFLRPEGPGGEE